LADESKPPEKGSGYFITIKIGGLALLVFIAMLALSSFFNKEFVPLWSDLVKLTLGYLFGTLSTHTVVKR